MDPSKIDSTLDLMTAEELAGVDRFVEVWERAGYMSRFTTVNCKEDYSP